jgi:hypothetical protein
MPVEFRRSEAEEKGSEGGRRKGGAVEQKNNSK